MVQYPKRYDVPVAEVKLVPSKLLSEPRQFRNIKKPANRA